MALDLEDHLDYCKEEYIMKQQELPRNERRALPQKPKGLNILLGKEVIFFSFLFSKIKKS
jgi:hypothetical protein